MVKSAVQHLVFSDMEILQMRFYIGLEGDIADAFLQKLASWAKNIKISDPLEEGCRIGPVVSGGQEVAEDVKEEVESQSEDESDDELEDQMETI